MDMNSAISAFDALAHDTRLSVFRLLVQAGPDGLPAGDIAERLGVVQNTMSSHLHKLLRADVVRSTRRGRQVIYSVDFESVKGLVLYLLEDCCGSQADVCRPIAESITESIAC